MRVETAERSSTDGPGSQVTSRLPPARHARTPEIAAAAAVARAEQVGDRVSRLSRRHGRRCPRSPGRGRPGGTSRPGLGRDFRGPGGSGPAAVPMGHLSARGPTEAGPRSAGQGQPGPVLGLRQASRPGPPSTVLVPAPLSRASSPSPPARTSSPPRPGPRRCRPGRSQHSATLQVDTPRSSEPVKDPTQVGYRYQSIEPVVVASAPDRHIPRPARPRSWPRRCR